MSLNGRLAGRVSFGNLYNAQTFETILDDVALGDCEAIFAIDDFDIEVSEPERFVQYDPQQRILSSRFRLQSDASHRVGSLIAQVHNRMCDWYFGIYSQAHTIPSELVDNIEQLRSIFFTLLQDAGA